MSIDIPALALRVRKRLNLTQREFEQLLGKGPKTVIRWEGGNSKPASAVLRLLVMLDARPSLAVDLRNADAVVRSKPAVSAKPLPKGTRGRFRLTVACPKCGASPNSPCVGLRKQPLKGLHHERKLEGHSPAEEVNRCEGTTTRGGQCTRGSEITWGVGLKQRWKGKYCRQHAKVHGQKWRLQKDVGPFYNYVDAAK